MPASSPSGLPPRRVYLHGNLAFKLDREIDHRSVRGGDARRETVELAGKLGEDERHRTSSAGGGGDHRHGGGAGTAQILMREIEDLLIVGVRMDGVHITALDAEVLQQDLKLARDSSWCTTRSR